MVSMLPQAVETTWKDYALNQFFALGHWLIDSATVCISREIPQTSFDYTVNRDLKDAYLKNKL